MINDIAWLVYDLEFWPVMNGLNMSTVCQIKASLCCIIGLNVNACIVDVYDQTKM